MLKAWLRRMWHPVSAFVHALSYQWLETESELTIVCECGGRTVYDIVVRDFGTSHQRKHHEIRETTCALEQWHEHLRRRAAARRLPAARSRKTLPR